MTTFGKTLTGIIVLVLLGLIWLFFGLLGPKEGDNLPPVAVTPSTATTFRECVAAGYPVAESYPRTCRTQEGATFTEDVGNVIEKEGLVHIDSPRPGDVVTSPLTVSGQARGKWFFEASFPVKLYDDAGNVLATGAAQADGDWMTTEFVPFKVTLTFTAPASGGGKLVLQKDNPSGLPENDDEVYFPVQFSK